MSRIVVQIEGQKDALFEIYPSHQQSADKGVLATRLLDDEVVILPSPIPNMDIVDALVTFESVFTREGKRARTDLDLLSNGQTSYIGGVFESIRGATIVSPELRAFPD